MATSNNTGPYLSGAMNVGTAMANKPVRELVRVSYDELTMQRTVSVMAEGGGGMRLTAHGVVELYNQDGEKYLTMGPNGFTDGTTTIDIGDAAARFATWAMVSCGGN